MWLPGHHADTRAEVCISLAWQAGTPSLPISPGKGLMGWLYCGPRGCCCLLLPAPVTTLFNKHEPIFRPRPSQMEPVSLSLACVVIYSEWPNKKICRREKTWTGIARAVTRHEVCTWVKSPLAVQRAKRSPRASSFFQRSYNNSPPPSFLFFCPMLRFKHSTYHSCFLRFIASTSGLKALHLTRSVTLCHAFALLLSFLCVSLCCTFSISSPPLLLLCLPVPPPPPPPLPPPPPPPPPLPCHPTC